LSHLYDDVVVTGVHMPTVSIILLSLLMLEAVIFGIFTGVMFFNQMWAVGNDETVRQCDFSCIWFVTDVHVVE